MTDKLGRNDPCWCGSNKKYKKCHWREDKRAKQTKQAAAPPPPSTISHTSPSSSDLTPEQIAISERWERFEAANMEGKIAIFEQAMDDGTLDEEDAFEMPFGIRDKSAPQDNPEFRELFATWIARIRAEYPEFYAQNWPYYTEALMKDIIADQKWEAVPEVLADVTVYADEHMDGFIRIQNILLYHGQHEPLLEAMRAVWDTLQDSGPILGWVIDEFYGTIILLIFYEYLETADEPRADDPVLWEQLELYGDPNRNWFKRATRYLTAPAPSAWQPQDFGETVDAEQWSENLDALLFEFMAEQHREAGIPFGRLNMMREDLYQLLYRQMTTAPATFSSLIPEPGTLDHGLGVRMNFLNPHTYSVAAVLELLPAYLHFITRLGLIHPLDMDRALKKLREIWENGEETLQRYGADRHCLYMLETAWSNEVLDALRDDPALAEARAQPPAPKATDQTPETRETMTFKVSYCPKPSVWFTVEMRGDQTLEDLHREILSVTKFYDNHLHAFYMSGQPFDRMTEYSTDPDAQNSSHIALNQLPLRLKQRFLYIFDFGDQHEFSVQLIATSNAAPKGRYPKIIKRRGKMPVQ